MWCKNTDHKTMPSLIQSQIVILPWTCSHWWWHFQYSTYIGLFFLSLMTAADNLPLSCTHPPPEIICPNLSYMSQVMLTIPCLVLYTVYLLSSSVLCLLFRLSDCQGVWWWHGRFYGVIYSTVLYIVGIGHVYNAGCQLFLYTAFKFLTQYWICVVELVP